jgi:hypothetical protein
LTSLSAIEVPTALQVFTSGALSGKISADG